MNFETKMNSLQTRRKIGDLNDRIESENANIDEIMSDLVKLITPDQKKKK